MKQMTVCFLLRYHKTPEVLLGFKKVGFGAGKYAGIGGKVEPGETVRAAAIREVEEEIGVTISDECIHEMGKVTFLFPNKPEWNGEVYIFTTREWQGEPTEGTEMKPSWFAPEKLPYDTMWQDARHWMPVILEGKFIQAIISFQADNETVDTICLS